MNAQAWRIGRRGLVLGGVASAVGGSRRARAEALPQCTLLVAGPPGARLDGWAGLLARTLGQTLSGHAALPVQNVGGLDGVTGANQFEARGEPDGSVALLVPGSAALSWLVGDTRVRFDPGRWVPLWAGAGSAVLVSRVPLVPGRTIRVAAEGPAGPELPVFIALDLLGIDGRPVGAASPDAVLLRGSDVAAGMQTASSSGMVPVMTLGLIGPDGTITRDPQFPDVPTAFDLLGPRAQLPLAGALRTAALVVQLQAGLVLPQLTPAALVALWRAACAPLLADPELAVQAGRLGTRMVPAAAAAECTSRIAGDQNLLLTLRRWLATRYLWQPA